MKNLITKSNFARSVLMVKPTWFYLNPETSKDNYFMKQGVADESQIQSRILKEFNDIKSALQIGGINVLEYEQMNEDVPDSIYPNNWISTHRFHDALSETTQSLLVTYPMKWESRQKERNPQIIDALRSDYEHFLDFDREQRDKLALEGTGSLIFDLKNQKIFVALSERCQEEALHLLKERIRDITGVDFKLVTFDMKDGQGRTVYHTNVGLAILEDHAVICMESIGEHDRERVLAEFTDPQLCPQGTYGVIDITFEQMGAFCGNLICLDNGGPKKVVLMSDRAMAAFSEDSARTLQSHYQIVKSDIQFIEDIGGGGARCMVAEIF